MNIEKEYPFSNRQVWLDLLHNLWQLYINENITSIFLSRGDNMIIVEDNISNYDDFVKAVLLDKHSRMSIKVAGKRNRIILCGYEYDSCSLTDDFFIIYRKNDKPIKIERSPWSNYVI